MKAGKCCYVDSRRRRRSNTSVPIFKRAVQRINSATRYPDVTYPKIKMWRRVLPCVYPLVEGQRSDQQNPDIPRAIRVNPCWSPLEKRRLLRARLPHKQPQPGIQMIFHWIPFDDIWCWWIAWKCLKSSEIPFCPLTVLLDWKPKSEQSLGLGKPFLALGRDHLWALSCLLGMWKNDK